MGVGWRVVGWYGFARGESWVVWGRGVGEERRCGRGRNEGGGREGMKREL